MTDSSRPLAGLTVIDLSQVEFGPCATQVLGDFGANVVKIERPAVGDISRSTDPYAAADGGESAYYLSLNRNKRSVVVDLRDPRGSALVKTLTERADVLVHNYRPGVAERLGLDYPTLRELNPGLIYAAGSGFGESGPLANRPGQDLLAQSLSGAVARNPDGSGTPQLYPTAVADYTAGMILVQGILLALYERDRTGRGQKVSVSLLDTMLAMQLQELTQWMLRGQPTNWVNQNLIGTFLTSDGCITVVGVFRPDPLKDICEALGIEDLTQRPEFASVTKAVENKAALWEILGAALAAMTTEEAIGRLEGKDVLCSPVLDETAALNHPQVASNEILTEFEHPTQGTVRTVGHPLRLSGHGAGTPRPAPMLGQHTREVLVEAGLDSATVDSLFTNGVCSE